MTHREDNECLDAVQDWLDARDEANDALDKVRALLAFVALCGMLFVALHLEACTTMLAVGCR